MHLFDISNIKMSNTLNMSDLLMIIFWHDPSSESMDITSSIEGVSVTRAPLRY
jgi:hypothetical protein